MAKVNVSVDHNRCVGSQVCIMFSPEVFELNEHGQSRIISLEGKDAKDILSTAEQCPQCAIKVSDSDTGEVLFPPPGLAF